MSITKTGIFNNGTLSEQHIESDGSIWELVFVHNRPAENKFDSTDSFTTGFSKNMNLYFNFNICNKLTSWELLVIQAQTEASTPKKRRWVQTANPLTATFANVAASAITKNTGTEYISSDSWGGLYKVNSGNTFLCANNGNSGNWWGATGSKVFYQGGIPAWFGEIVSTGYVFIYVRVDNQFQNNARLYKNNIGIANNFYEY